MSVAEARPDWETLALAVSVSSAVLVALALVVRALRPPLRPQGSAGTAPVVVLVAVLGASLAVLVPGQSAVALGLEVSVLGILLGVTAVVQAPPAPAAPSDRARALVPLVSAAGLLVGGVVLESDDASGFYWLFGGAVAGLLLAVGMLATHPDEPRVP